MSEDSIKRSDAIKALHEEWDGGWLEVTGEWIADNCEAVLNRLPSADRAQGEWIDVNGDGSLWRCNQCKDTACCKGNFCSNCGRRMKGADDE